MKSRNIAAFQHARFGMFIHFGLYSIPGGRWHGQPMDYIGEWIQSRFRISNEEYSRLAEQFDPRCFNAEEWVKCAKDAGMAYIVFTAKHHDGFAMYHSRVSRYNIVEATPFGRDILRELAYACKRHDMKLGIYYSHCLDWSEADGADPGPNAGKNFGMSWGNDWDFPDYKAKDFSRYFERKAMPQIKELLSEYGPIFLMWFDCPLQITPEQGQQLRSMVKALQPDCLINSRIGHNLGDFGSLGDNQHPAGQTEFPLESPNTLNQTWGFKKDDHAWMSARKVVSDLAAMADKNVNYLLNIGPRADGRFPDASIDILHEVAEWRQRHGVIIQNTAANPFPQSLSWGWCTASGNVLQFFVQDRQGNLIISGLRNKINSCTVPFSQRDGKVELFLPEGEDSLLPVIKLDFDGPLNIDQRLMPQNGVMILSPVRGGIIHGKNVKGMGLDTQMGPAAEIIAENDYCSLDESGALTQWHHPGDGICWPVSFPEAGIYRIQVITENRCHSVPWTGGRTVKLEFVGRRLEAELEEDKPFESSFYSRAGSEIGTIEIAASAQGILKFSTALTNKKEAVNMNLIAIKLYKSNKEQ